MSQGAGAAIVTRKPTSPAVSGLPLHTSRLGGGARRATAGSSIGGSVGSSLNVVGRVLLPSSKLSRVPGTGSMAHLTSAATRTKTPPVTTSGSVVYASEVSSTTTSITAKHLGQLVTIAGVQTGTLRYFGPTDFEEGLWCGIELESPVGKNNGTVKGTQYFICAENYGIFAPVYKVTLQSEVDSFKPFLTSKHSRKSCGPIVINGKQVEVESPVEPGPPPSSPVITSTTSVAGVCSQQTPFSSKGPNKRPKPEGGLISGATSTENCPQVISSAVELKRRRLDLSQRSWSASSGAVKYSKIRPGQFGVKLPSFSQVNLRDEMEDSNHFDDSPLFTPPKSFAEFAVERSQRRHMYDSTPKLVEGVFSPPVQTAFVTPHQTCSEFDREDEISQDDNQIVPTHPDGGEDAPRTDFDFDNNLHRFSAEPLTFVVYSEEKPQRPKTLLGLASTGVSSEDSSEQGGILGVSTPEFITGDGTSSALSIPTEGGSCCGSSEDVSSSDGPLLENESSLGLLTPSQLQEWNSFNGNEDDDDLYKHLRSPSVDELEDFEEEEDRTVDQDLIEERLRSEEMRLQEEKGVGTSSKASCSSEAGGPNPPAPLSSVPEQPEDPSSLEDPPVDSPPPSSKKKGPSNKSFLDETNASSVTIMPPPPSGEDGPASLRESGYCGGSDPMTDSDFNTESDAEPGESDEVRQKHREARVIDGALYTVSSSHSSHSSKDSGSTNMMATSSASITTSSTTSVSVSEMESSGFYSDSTSASGSSGSSGRRAWRHLSSDCDDQKSSKQVTQVDEYGEDSVKDEDELPFERTLIANEEKDSNTSSFSNGASSPNAPQAPGQLGCPKESVHSSPKKFLKKTLPVSKSDHTGNLIGYLRSSAKQKVRSQSVNCIASLAPNTESIAKDLHKLKSTAAGAAGGLKVNTNKTRVTPANPVAVASKTGHQQQLSFSGVSGTGVVRRSSQSSSIANAASPARKTLISTNSSSPSSTTTKSKVGVKLGLDKLSKGRKDLHGGSSRSLASTGTTGGGGSPASVRRIVKEPTPGAVPKKWEAVMNKIAESKQSHAKIDVSHVKSKVFNSFKAPSSVASSSISKTQKTVILVKDKENSAPVPPTNGSVCSNPGSAHPFSSRSSTSSDFSNDDQPTARPSRVHPHSKHRAKKDASKSSTTTTTTTVSTNNNNRQISDLSTASDHSKGTDQISTKRSTTNKNNNNLNTEGGSSSTSTITKVSASSHSKGIKPASKQVGIGSSSGLVKKKDTTGNVKATSTNNKSGGVTLGTGKGQQQQGSQGKTTSGGPRDRNRNAPATKASAAVVVPSSQENSPTTQVFIDNVKSGSDKVNSNNNAKPSGRKNSSVSVVSPDQQTSKEFAKVVFDLEERLQSLTKDSEVEKHASQSKISCLELTRDALSVVIQQQISQGSARENQLQQEIVNYIEQIRNNAILFNDKCKDLENLQTELDRERECHKEELAEVNKEHAKLVETLVKDHSQALADAKKESEEVIGKLRKEHVEEVQKLKESFRLEVEELEKKHKEALNAHRKLSPHDLLVKEIDSLEAVLEMRNHEVRSLRTDLVNYKATIEELKDSQELVRTLHANKEDLNAQMDKSRKDKAVLQERIQELESHLTSVECEKSDLTRKYEQVCFKYQSRREAAGGGDLSSSIDDLNS